MTAWVNPSVSASIAGVSGAVEDGSVTIDSSSIPYASASITLPLTAETALDDLDPRDGDRITVSASNTGSWAPTYGPWLEARRNLAPNPSFETNTTGWGGSGGATLVRDTTQDYGHGSASCKVTAATASNASGDIRFAGNGSTTTFPAGVAPGDTITMSAWINRAAPLNAPYGGISSRQGRILIFVSTNGTSYTENRGALAPNVTGWQRISHTVTIPANATGVLLSVGCAGSPTDVNYVTYVDAVLVERSATLGAYFDGASTPADAARERYVWTGTANASASVCEARESGDSVWTPATPRVFDLGIRSREIDHTRRTVEIIAGSDELLAQDYAPLAVDTGARALEGSLRAVCDYVLGKVGLGNLQPNPNFTANIDGVTMAPSQGTVAWNSAGGLPSGGCLLITVTGTGAAATTGTYVPIKPGQAVTASMYVKGGGASPLVGRQARVRITWQGGPGGNVYGPYVPLGTSYGRIAITATAPAGVTGARMDVYFEANAATGTVLSDQWQLEYASTASPFKNGVLEAGGPDADVTAYWPVTNLFPDPSAEVTPTAWVPDVGAPTIVRDGNQFAPPYSGSYLLRVQATSTGGMSIAQAVAVGVTQGRVYTAAVYLRSAATIVMPAPRVVKSARIILRFTGPTGNFIRDVRGAYATTSASEWTRYVLTAPAPTGATGVRLYIEWQGPHAVSNLHFVDGIMLHEGDEVVPFFTGSSPASSTYTYEWTDVANASTSTRTPVVERSPELFVWKPGVTAWDFLAPLITPASLRLFCDELRAWRLIDPAKYSVPGLVSMSPSNATSATDTISRDDPYVFATGIVCEYLWEDSNGIPRVKYDAAGTPDKVAVFSYRRAYPGPGGAAAILFRRNGSGRTQDVEGLAVWSATPGMEASVALPPSLPVHGKVTSIQFSLGDDGLMRVGTRELIDIADASIDALVGTIDALVGTIDGLPGTLAKTRED